MATHHARTTEQDAYLLVASSAKSDISHDKRSAAVAIDLGARWMGLLSHR